MTLHRFKPTFILPIVLLLQIWYCSAQDSTMLQRAEAAYNAGQYEDAINQCTGSVLIEPQTKFAALLLRGKAYHEQKYYAEAIADFSEASLVDPEQAEPFALLGYTCFVTGDYDKARKNYTCAVDRDRNNAVYQYNLGTVLSRELKWKAAVAAYSEAINKKKGYFEAFVNRADAYGVLKKYRNAVADYDSALAIQPRNPELFILRGMNLISLGRNTEAIQMFNRSLRYKPANGNAYFSRGRAYLELRQFAKARADFDSAILFMPSLGIAWFYHGVAVLEIDKTQRSEGCGDFKKAAELGYGEAWDYLEKFCE